MPATTHRATADDDPIALPDHVQVAIVGTGFSGLGMAIRLKQRGMDDFIVLERAGDVGGTWRDNTYPGCQCDVPSHLYSFSFASNPGWSRTFSEQPEIWEYLRRCADDYGVRPHIRCGHEVTAARWDDEHQRWEIETSQGAMTADVVVAGPGGLSEPSIPAIPGRETFEGVAFHSASWDHDHDLRGRRVAVIGTGASTIQIVPRIQPEVSELKLFQRTAPWIMPHSDRPVSRLESALYRYVPGAQKAMRNAIYWAREVFVVPFMHPKLGRFPEQAARRHLRSQVPDPELRRKLMPTYAFGCKRVLLSNDYYPALCESNVDVVTDGIAEIRPHSIVTADGAEHEVDTIVYGTGFQVNDQPIAQRVWGRDGVKLADAWAQGMEAYLGTAIAGFPNMFMLLGPNTGLGHTSVVVMIEAQIDYVMDCLRTMRRSDIATLEVRREAQSAFNDEIQRALQGSVWNAGGCASWYLDASGRNTTLWPGSTLRFRRRARRFRAAEYEARAAWPQRDAVAA
jgi:cation diffusion facilitator CzcD-associated flavoprotein CzcO